MEYLILGEMSRDITSIVSILFVLTWCFCSGFVFIQLLTAELLGGLLFGQEEKYFGDMQESQERRLMLMLSRAGIITTKNFLILSVTNITHLSCLNKSNILIAKIPFKYTRHMNLVMLFTFLDVLSYLLYFRSKLSLLLGC